MSAVTLDADGRVACPLCGASLTPLSLATHLRQEGVRASEVRQRWPELHRLGLDARIAAERPRIEHALDDAITCLVCGRGGYHILGGRHLATHGLDARSYRERFPGAPITSPHFKAVSDDILKDLHGPGYWDRERIIAALRKATERTGKVPYGKDWEAATQPGLRGNRKKRSRPTTTRVRQVFGSWSAALREAGLEPRHLTHCKHGHSFEGNTYIDPRSGYRQCRTCRREARRAARRHS